MLLVSGLLNSLKVAVLQINPSFHLWPTEFSFAKS